MPEACDAGLPTEEEIRNKWEEERVAVFRAASALRMAEESLSAALFCCTGQTSLRSVRWALSDIDRAKSLLEGALR